MASSVGEILYDQNYLGSVIFIRRALFVGQPAKADWLSFSHRHPYPYKQFQKGPIQAAVTSVSAKSPIAHSAVPNHMILLCH